MIGPGRDTTEEMLQPAFRLLERFARDEANLKIIRQHGGVECLVAQLENHADNDIILRAGGRLLGRVAADDLESALEQLKRGGLSDKARCRQS